MGETLVENYTSARSFLNYLNELSHKDAATIDYMDSYFKMRANDYINRIVQECDWDFAFEKEPEVIGKENQLGLGF